MSTAYGWDDEHILDMTIRRIRQASAAIDEASWMKSFQSRQLVAWQTRMICSWLVKLTPDMEADMANKLLKEAASISLDNMLVDEDSDSPSVVRPNVPKVATRKDFYNMSDEEIEKHLGQSDNGNGSFEALLRGFGRG